MKIRNKHLLFLFLIPLIFCLSDCRKQELPFGEKLENFFKKDEVTIAVTDSGLGGLSIMAEAVEKIKETKIFSKVNFIFFNALFSLEGGYNSLKTRKEKIQIFDSALRSLEENCHPDLILIGCNTLSILYQDTPFARQTELPVVGIVEAGVDLIVQSLKTFPESKVIIFATQTTIEEETHKRELEKKGIASERIALQACPELVNYIENGYASEETEMLILAYVDEALQSLDVSQPSLFVSLNCTHYGYSLDLWKQAFQSYGTVPLDVLNPNSNMLNFLFKSQMKNRYASTDIAVRVISMVEIGKEKIASISKWLDDVSSQTSAALIHYELKPDLFEWKKHITAER